MNANYFSLSHLRARRYLCFICVWNDITHKGISHFVTHFGSIYATNKRLHVINWHLFFLFVPQKLHESHFFDRKKFVGFITGTIFSFLSWFCEGCSAFFFTHKEKTPCACTIKECVGPTREVNVWLLLIITKSINFVNKTEENGKYIKNKLKPQPQLLTYPIWVFFVHINRGMCILFNRYSCYFKGSSFFPSSALNQVHFWKMICLSNLMDF